jgi:membrane protease YdiL (CAAX protease family)
VRRLLICLAMSAPASDEVSLSPPELPAVRASDAEERFTAGAEVDVVRRAVAWSAMLVGSAVPNIVCRVTGHGSPYFLPVTQTIILVLTAIAVDRWPRLRPLKGFLLTLAILRLGWFFVAPVLADWRPIHDLSLTASWGAQQLIARLLNVAGGILMVATVIGRGFTREDLFLRVGQLDAPAKPEPLLWFRKPISWTQFGPQLLLIFGVALPLFLFFTLKPNFDTPVYLWELLPWAIATAAVNAANEEFQFRCVPLAHLRGLLPLRECLWLTAIFFGLGHYFGQPSGPIGVVMATIAGWLWAKSMVETRGLVWAFGIHMVQDMVIFYFLALAARS